MNRRNALTYVAAGLVAGVAFVSVVAGVLLFSSSSPRGRVLRASFFERTDGTTLFYRDWGEGKAIVFVASASMPSGMWAHQMLPLVQAGYRCVAFDRRGHGRSSDPGGGYDLDTLADDLAAVIETLELRNIVLVGHSMGCGEITRSLTRHGTERVARIAFIAPTTPFVLKTADNPQGIDKATFEKLRAGWMLDYPQWLNANARPFVVPETSEAQIQWVINMMLQTSLQAVIECNVAATEADIRAELRRIDRPVLIVHGTVDRSAPIDLTGRPTSKLLPQCQLQVYEGAPHGVFLTHMERLNADLLRFVRT